MLLCTDAEMVLHSPAIFKCISELGIDFRSHWG